MTRTNRRSFYAAAVFALCGASPVLAQTAVAPNLGAASPFAVLGGSAVTCVGPGNVNGDVGSAGALTPGTCTISGATTTPVSGGVITAFNNAFNAMDTQNPVCTGTIPPGGGALSPGVWCSAAGVTITGIITLSGNASDVWVFRVGTGAVPGALTLTNSQVVMGGSALACNVYWKTSAGATMTNSIFNGTLLSGAAVTMTDGSWTGRAMATSAVSLTRPAPMSFSGCSAPATITVNKDFIPNNTATVPVSLACSSGTVTTAPATMSETAPAVFRVGGASLAGATCTATETVPTGYTANQAGCAGVALNGSCTITNTAVCPAITLSPPTLPDGTVGVAYTQTISGSGGVAPYVMSLVSGALPAGVTLTAAGVLAGTPTTAGSSTFTIRGTDANGCFAERAYTIVVAAAPPVPPVCPVFSLDPVTLPNGGVGIAYSQVMTGSGGAAPYAFGVTAGTLPAGLTLTAAGLLAGTPTTAGSTTITIRATDANGCLVERPYTIVIVTPPGTCPAITLSPTVLANGTVGTPYLQNITASGGTAPYVFTTNGATIPAGLVLSTGGVLSGTPTAAVPQTFTVRGTDSLGCFALATFTVTIVESGVVPPPPIPPTPGTCPAITLFPATLPAAVVGSAYSQTFTASGGTAPYVFTTTAANLPAGLSLTSAGVLAGTPASATPQTFTVRGSDALGCFAERPFSIVFGVAVPTMPQVLYVLLAFSLLLMGYRRVRNHARPTA